MANSPIHAAALRAIGFLQGSPNSTDPGTRQTASRIQQIAATNPDYMWASQKAPAAGGTVPRAAVVQISPVDYADPLQGLLRTEAGDQAMINAAAHTTQAKIDAALHNGATRVVLDEIRRNTEPVAERILSHLPAAEQGKLAAYVVGGPGIHYGNNPTLSGVWDGMRRNRVEALPETYGGPEMDIQAGAQDAAQKVAWLNAHGIAASPAVSPLNRYHNPTGALAPDASIDPTTTTEAEWRDRVGNEHALRWVAALRAAMPDVPLSEWGAGGTASTGGIAPGRAMLYAILRRQ